ncbi:hypothetical protein [Methanosarcina horonobensis]|uniref:hypothetical protein n=1 Tax=Methanosarcina horonobensis TaxID=418008 RepID=UPI000A578490|nr:hypothetical protein [Methanosarcina horonobensis]
MGKTALIPGIFFNYLKLIGVKKVRFLAVNNNKIGALGIYLRFKKTLKLSTRETFATTAAIPMTIPRVVT